MAQYDYSISGDTAQGQVDIPQLFDELLVVAQQNPGFPALTMINSAGDTLSVFYASPLSGPQESSLTTAVSAHTPQAPAAPPPTIDNRVDTVSPTVTDDDSMGFAPTSRWVDVSGQQEYLCTDSSTGSAVWKATTTPSAHAISHESGNPDEIDVTSLSGVLADAQLALPHAAEHLSTGLDPIAEFDGATSNSDGLDGLVTKPLQGEQALFLKGDGTWAAPSAGGTFGQDMQAVASTARSTTTSSSFQTKLTLTTPTLTGAYRLFWTAVIDQSNTQDSVEVRLRDTTAASTVGAVQRLEPKDTDNRMFAGGLAGFSFSAESKSFSIQWRQVDGSTAGIQSAAIEIWRIS